MYCFADDSFPFTMTKLCHTLCPFYFDKGVEHYILFLSSCFISLIMVNSILNECLQLIYGKIWDRKFKLERACTGKVLRQLSFSFSHMFWTFSPVKLKALFKVILLIS